MLRKICALCVCLLLVAECGAFAAPFRFSPRPNSAHRIQWREWGPEALAEARRTNRLILLSLSAVWCHWCHVMDESTYSDEEIIRLINERFVPVRVDADLRPDLDSLYNQGGWPSTAILTADGTVIDGGNYVPPAEMKERLARAASLPEQDLREIVRRREEARLRRTALRSTVLTFPDRDAIEGIVGTLKDAFDEQYGGFGTGQKFPNADALEFLLAAADLSEDPRLRRIVTVTLDRMAAGPLRDRVEGGFFRYATRRDWSEPHYEKLLDVNAGMVRSYALGALAEGTKAYHRVLRETAAYVRKNLADVRSGAFFGSQDADEAYYRKKDRKGLAPPAVDRRSYADSSSLMISALASAYEATGDAQYRSLAEQGAEFLSQHLFSPDDGVLHFFADGRAGLPGLLNDNALFGSALLDMAAATGDRWYLERAEKVGQIVIGRFYDRGNERFRPSLTDIGTTHARLEEHTNIAGNLANYRALRFLGRLQQVHRDRGRQEIVDAVLRRLSGGARTFSPHAPAYGLAALNVLAEPVEITVVAESGGAEDYLAGTRGTYLPNKVVRVLSPSRDADEVRRLNYEGGDAVYFCRGKRCSKPVRDPGKVQQELRKFLRTEKPLP